MLTRFPVLGLLSLFVISAVAHAIAPGPADGEVDEETWAARG